MRLEPLRISPTYKFAFGVEESFHQVEGKNSTFPKKQRRKKRVLRMYNLLVGSLESQKQPAFSMITKPSNQLSF